MFVCLCVCASVSVCLFDCLIVCCLVCGVWYLLSVVCCLLSGVCWVCLSVVCCVRECVFLCFCSCLCVIVFSLVLWSQVFFVSNALDVVLVILFVLISLPILLRVSMLDLFRPSRSRR